MRKAVFFDRDGVINKVVDRGAEFALAGRRVRYTAPWYVNEVEIYPDAEAVVRQVRERDYLAIMITNQPDVHYKALPERRFQRVHQRILGIGFDDVFACRHGREHACECRKPKPGMLREASKKWNINLALSFFVGDMSTDMQAASAAGCQGVLVRREHNADVWWARTVLDLSELLPMLD